MDCQENKLSAAKRIKRNKLRKAEKLRNLKNEWYKRNKERLKNEKKIAKESNVDGKWYTCCCFFLFFFFLILFLFLTYQNKPYKIKCEQKRNSILTLHIKNKMCVYVSGFFYACACVLCLCGARDCVRACIYVRG